MSIDMYYYKIIDGNENILNVDKTDDYDDILDEIRRLNDEDDSLALVVIDKNEYENILSKTSSTSSEIKDFFFTITPMNNRVEKDEPETDEEIVKYDKQVILNMFASAGILPSIEDLERYYGWYIGR